MLNKHFQSAIYQYVGIVEYPFGIIDENGTIIAASSTSSVGKKMPVNMDLITDGAVFTDSGITYKPVFSRSKFDFCVYVENTNEISKKCAQLLAASFITIKQHYEEKYDTISFIKNIVLDSVLPGDIYVRSKELKLEYEKSRIVFAVSLPSPDDSSVNEILQGIFPEKGKQFVITIDEKNYAVILEMPKDAAVKDKTKIAREIINMIRSDAMVNVCVGIGSVTDDLRGISTSYREAQLAIEIGRVFDNDKEILNYEALGIGRLIYQLPVKLCQMYLDEVFKNGSIEKLDQETILTIQKFFDNSLNISETSRRLFIHRNTLVYRLDKIQKLTGLDLRQFDDAIIFKVAMMVKKYLSANVMKI